MTCLRLVTTTVVGQRQGIIISLQRVTYVSGAIHSRNRAVGRVWRISIPVRVKERLGDDIRASGREHRSCRNGRERLGLGDRRRLVHPSRRGCYDVEGLGERCGRHVGASWLGSILR